MTDKPLKKAPGRPRKIKSVPVDKFIRIVKEPFDDDNLIEWTYTEPQKFNKFMKTFKSCDIEDIYMYFTETHILFKGKVVPE